MKYFIIGFNKCGTSTFHNIFIENGIKSTHSTKWHLVLDEYDAFSDNGNLNDYKKLLNDKARPLFNRALTGQYPPGSTLKPFFGLVALEDSILDKSKYTGW